MAQTEAMRAPFERFSSVDFCFRRLCVRHAGGPDDRDQRLRHHADYWGGGWVPENSNSLLARINFFREEPGGSKKRVFINDLNGPLYILDKETKKLTTYLNFNGLSGQPGRIYGHSGDPHIRGSATRSSRDRMDRLGYFEQHV